MTKPLTAVAIANLKPKPQRYEVSDGGCPGLRVAVFPSKKKSFIVRYRFRGLQRKLTLGPVLVERGVAESGTAPELDAPLSLVAARELATKKLREAKSGHDPAAAKQRARQERHAAEADTLQALCEEHLRLEAGRLRTLDGQRRPDLELFYPALGQLPIDQIRRGQFVRVLDHVAETRGRRRAGRAFGNMKTLLNWYSNRSDYVSVLTRARTTWRTSGPEGGRDRTLDDAEITRIWLAAEQDEGPFGAFIRFVLLTASRRNEAGGLHRSELIEGDSGWLIPGGRYKSKRDTLIPLSRAAQKIIATRPATADFLFGADGTRPLGGFAERKAAFDKICGVTGWRIHDLRRTARALMSRREAGIAPDIAERCLGHVITGMPRVYNRHDYKHEKLDAFEKLAALIEGIVHPPSGNVLPMTKGRRK